MPCSANMAIAGPLARARVKRAAVALVVAVCRAAVLLAVAIPSFDALGGSEEVSACAKIELANPLEGLARESLGMKSRRHRARRAWIGHGDRALRLSQSAVWSSRAGGHRLANGLCAPIRC